MLPTYFCKGSCQRTPNLTQIHELVSLLLRWVVGTFSALKSVDLFRLTVNVCRTAAETGNLEVLQWICSQEIQKFPCPRIEIVCTAAVLSPCTQIKCTMYLTSSDYTHLTVLWTSSPNSM